VKESSPHIYAKIATMSEYFHASPRTMRRFMRVQSLIDQLDPEAAPQALLAPGSPQPRGTIIVFPGSFNPPTTAHLALLKQAREFAYQHLGAAGGQPIQLYAAMSKRIVDKERVERPLLLDRVMLLSMLLRRRLPHTGVMLFNRGLYVEQAQAVWTAFPKVRKLFFLIGFDKIVQILDPRYYEDRDAALMELFKLAELLVAPRGTGGLDALTALLQQPDNQPFAPYIHALPFNAAYRTISSTRIRQHSAEHWHEVPQEVRRFMIKTRAYAPPLRRVDGTTVDYYAERVKELEARLKKLNGGK
jgi:nicotinic acid mononucleotide adenylyltransferase